MYKNIFSDKLIFYTSFVVHVKDSHQEKKISLSRRETMIHEFKSVKAHIIEVQTFIEHDGWFSSATLKECYPKEFCVNWNSHKVAMHQNRLNKLCSFATSETSNRGRVIEGLMLCFHMPINSVQVFTSYQHLSKRRYWVWFHLSAPDKQIYEYNLIYRIWCILFAIDWTINCTVQNSESMHWQCSL